MRHNCRVLDSESWVPLLACPAVPKLTTVNTAGQASSGTLRREPPAL